MGEAINLVNNFKVEKVIFNCGPYNDFLIQKVINFYQEILNPQTISSIPREILIKLKEIGLDKIVFDYQGYEYETDHILMGRKEISRQALLKSLITSSLIGLNVDVHFVPMKLNYEEIGDILEMLEISQIKNISLLNFLPQGRGKINEDQLQLSNEEKKEFFELLEKYRRDYSGNIRIGIPLQDESTHKCNAGLEKLDVKFDRTVLPCPAFKEITEEECRKFNIELPNIYTNLEDIKIPGKGTRKTPLCKQIYERRRQNNRTIKR
jgi:MoaA/NifB/PqqE/SkfB family radical SAM enzyme